MIDAVLSYHMSAATCGVAKFNHALAQRLGVPCDSLLATHYKHPLLSLKASELEPFPDYPDPPFDVFWHDTGRPSITRLADRVFYATEIGCPSTIDGNRYRGAYRVLVFGMAHKLMRRHFEGLKVTLDAEHRDYTVELSTAVHEGNPWDDGLTQGIEMMREVFGHRLRVLGFLADDAIARLLIEVDAVAAFYDPAFRANNTTGWAAISAGKKLYTNVDEHSPALDIATMPTWQRLTDLLSGVPCVR